MLLCIPPQIEKSNHQKRPYPSTIGLEKVEYETNPFFSSRYLCVFVVYRENFDASTILLEPKSCLFHSFYSNKNNKSYNKSLDGSSWWFRQHQPKQQTNPYTEFFDEQQQQHTTTSTISTWRNQSDHDNEDD